MFRIDLEKTFLNEIHLQRQEITKETPRFIIFPEKETYEFITLRTTIKALETNFIQNSPAKPLCILLFDKTLYKISYNLRYVGFEDVVSIFGGSFQIIFFCFAFLNNFIYFMKNLNLSLQGLPGIPRTFFLS